LDGKNKCLVKKLFKVCATKNINNAHEQLRTQLSSRRRKWG